MESSSIRSPVGNAWTCVRMARADYCGDGVSHTHDGTCVDAWDNASVNVAGRGPSCEDAGAPAETFEAAWNKDRALCLNHVRWTSMAATCLNPIPPCSSESAAVGIAQSSGVTTPLVFDNSYQH